MRKRQTKRLFGYACLILVVAAMILVAACAEPTPTTPAPTTPAPTTPAPTPPAPTTPAPTPPAPTPPAPTPPAPTPPAPTPPAPVKATRLTINNPTPPGNPMEAMLLRWAKDFEEKTGGRYTVEVVSGGALGSTMEAYDSVVGGVADIAFFQPPMIEKPFPLAEIPVLFWGPTPAEIFSKIWYHDIYKEGYLDEELAGVKVLTLYWGPVGDVDTVNPVNTVAELEGLKLANAQGATCIELMDRLGAVSVLAGPPDIYVMLQKGIADGMFGAVPMILEFHLDEFIQYLLPIQTTHMSHVVGMNWDVYNNMPDDVKKIVDEMANDDEYGVSAARDLDAWYDDGLQYAYDHGCTYCEWSDEDIAKLNEVAGAIWEEEMVKLDGMGLPGREVCDKLYNGALAMGADPAEIAFGYTPGG